MPLGKLTPLRVAIVLVAGAALVLYLRRPRVPEGSNVSDACWSDETNALSVLFVGNSHTFVNDLPRMFCGLASDERPLRVRSVTAPGWSLEQHWLDGVALRELREAGPWSYVVLQDHSTAPLSEPAEFEARVKRFTEVARASGARPAIYELWPRRDIRQDGETLHRTYADVARRAEIVRVPVGPAWTAFLRRRPADDLFQADGYHAAPTGTYLAACVFFSAFLAKSAEGKLPIEGMSDELALDLQRTAWQAIEAR